MKANLKKKIILSLALILCMVVSAMAVSAILETFYYQRGSSPVQFVIIRETWIPRSAFVLSAFPLAISAHIKYGENSFAIVDAEVRPFFDALSSAEFLVVGAHGLDGSVSLDDGAFVGPAFTPKNDNLKFVYFGSCYLGKKRLDWERKYSEAEIVAYDGLTTPFRGWLFLFFEAPFKLFDLRIS